MSRNKRISLNKKINPLYIVFCEGETEESYSSFLKQKYRVPIQIKTKVTGQKITDTYIKNYIKEIRKNGISDLDKNYLMYDVDSKEFTDCLNNIKNGILLASNPSIELWFLLHYRNHNSYLESGNCTQSLINLNKTYKKGKLNNELVNVLDTKILDAVNRAKLLIDFNNPSSTIYKFIEELEKIKKKQ